MGLMPGEIITLPKRILGNGADSSCGNNDVIKTFWPLSGTTGFIEGGSFNLRRRGPVGGGRKVGGWRDRGWKVFKKLVGELEGSLYECVDGWGADDRCGVVVKV